MKHKLRITIIDDEDCIRDSLKWHLEDLGHDVQTAPEPLLCHVYQGHFCSQVTSCGDALLIDYNMPNMTGLEFIQQLKERGCWGMTKNMMIMSGDTSEIDLDRAARLGVTIEQKPISFETIETWLAGIAQENHCRNFISH